MTPPIARGRRILVVEDEYFIADELRLALERYGATVVGPVPTVQAARAVILSDERLDGATLDVALSGETSAAVAELLAERGIPAIVTTGYDDQALPEPLRRLPLYQKPVNVEDALRTLLA